MAGVNGARPLVAIAGRPLAEGRVSRWKNAAVASPRHYLDAVRRAGGQEAVLMPVPLSAAEASSLLSRFDALVLPGGGDVDPACFGAEAADEVYGVDADIDDFELALAAAAVDAGLPTLGVCRGLQVLNVALGGNLTQHITGQEGLLAHGVPGVVGAMHAVRVEPGTRLAKAVGGDCADCSSHHHQAVDRLGAGLVPVGWADDGIVEGVELDSDAWVVAVQWHPEDTAMSDPAQQGLFDALVAATA